MQAKKYFFCRKKCQVLSFVFSVLQPSSKGSENHTEPKGWGVRRCGVLLMVPAQDCHVASLLAMTDRGGVTEYESAVGIRECLHGRTGV